ncbi:hypothetical protein MNBD_NITROSPINAE04-2647 [hydrothermal vent metagenome]|uniref:Tyr recombinase domain-containing protein n=1 Tax=hydrothermal vent metagenome TaxID=652676 RepID=A0A3B1BSG4_9ZZZZ
MTALKPSGISFYKSERRKAGRKEATIRNELALLSNAYTLAFKEWDLINENPFLKVKLPIADNKRVRWLTDEEKDKLFSVKKFEWMFPIIKTLRETGARLTNVLELQWSQVDFKRKMIFFPMTKSGKPVGLPMTNELFETLASLRKNLSQEKIVPMSGYVFPKKDGFPRKRRTFERSFKLLCRDAGIEDLVPHDLRHDCASRLVRAGVHLKTIMDWLGHSSLSMTLRYAHLGRDEVMENAARMLNREC